MLQLSGGEEGEAKLSVEDPSWKPGPRLLPIPAGTKDALCIPNKNGSSADNVAGHCVGKRNREKWMA